MVSRPFFSIVIPCHNQAHFIGDALQSAVHQDFEDWEVIVVNDGSTDDTEKIVGAMIKSDKRIRLVNKKNGGLSSARNAGMRVATGRFFQFLDADDYLLPAGLNKVFQQIAEQQECDLLRTGYQYVDESNTRALHRVCPGEKTAYLPDVFANNLGPCHSIFIKKEMALNLGEFDEELRSAEDWDFWIRAVKAGAKVKTYPEPVVAYRYVNNSMSRDPFIMYEALKTVTLRGFLSDPRIKTVSELNKDYDFDYKPVLVKQLFTCLGVAVMQGKLGAAITLLNRETGTYSLKYAAPDFKYMYSYLTFRYWNSKEEVSKILNVFYPNFRTFFQGIGLSEPEIIQSLDSVFRPVKKVRNQIKYGQLCGRVLNKLFYS